MTHRKASLLTLAALLLAATLVPSAAEARRRGGPHFPRHRPHFYIGAEATGLVVLAERLENFGTLGHGGGGGLFLGVRFGRWVSLEANWHMTVHSEFYNEEAYLIEEVDSHQLQTLSADVKIHIPTWGIVEPYVQAGGGWAFFGLTGHGDPDGGWLYQSGPMFNVGGGADLWFGPFVSLGVRALYQGVYLNESRYDLRVSDPDGNNKRTQPSRANYINGLALSANVALHF